jgi:hypothetical protein
MALARFFGFETGTIVEREAESANVTDSATQLSASTAQAKTGDYSLKVTGSAATTAYYRCDYLESSGRPGAGIDLNVLYLSFHLYVDSLPNTAENILRVTDDGSFLTAAQLQLDTDGHLNLLDETGSTEASGTTALGLDEWHYIELKLTCNDAGAYELIIDDSSEYSGTGDFHNTGSTNFDAVDIGKYGGLSSSGDWYFDNVCIS